MKISDLPHGSNPKALNYPHFPARWLGVVWRNWNRIHPARIAEVLETTEQEIFSAMENVLLNAAK